MDKNICFNCGNATAESEGLFVCPVCGAVMPDGVSSEEGELLDAAFGLLHESRFDEAKAAFEDIICKYPYHPEGYFGRLRARYHITYVMTVEKKLVPRCPTRSGAKIAEDVDYRLAAAYADEETKGFLQAQAEYLQMLCTSSEGGSSKNITHQFTMDEVDSNDATVIPPKLNKKGIWVALFLAVAVLLAAMTGYDRNWTCEVPAAPTLAEEQKEDEEEEN